MLVKGDNYVFSEVLERAGLKEPFNKLSSTISPVEVRGDHLFLRGLYYASENKILIPSHSLNKLIKGKPNWIMFHESAHHAHKNFLRAYLISNDSDLASNTLSFLDNNKSLSKIINDIPMNSDYSEIISTSLFNQMDNNLIEGFAVKVGGCTVPIIKLAKSIINLMIIGFVLPTKTTTITSLISGVIFYSLIGLTFNYGINQLCKDYRQDFYKQWVKDYKPNERLALLAFSQKIEGSDELLEDLYEYSLVV